MYLNENKDSIIDKITNNRKIHIATPPNNSKDPNPKAERTIPNKGKQQGDVIAVNTIPITPMRSSIFLLFINMINIYKSILIAPSNLCATLSQLMILKIASTKSALLFLYFK